MQRHIDDINLSNFDRSKLEEPAQCQFNLWELLSFCKGRALKISRNRRELA